MDTQSKKVPAIDPARRFFQPRERVNLDLTRSFSVNGTEYKRGLDNVIRRVSPKVSGKKAKRAATR